MKKTLKLISIMLVLVALCSIFAGCNKISKSYAEKINEAVKNGEPYTLEQVLKDLGDSAVNRTTALGTGYVYAVKGCDSYEDIFNKIKAGEEVVGITVYFLLGKASWATFKTIDLSKE